MHLPRYGQPLTATEVRVLTLFGEGMTIKEIAHAMGRSERTVEEHLKAARGKYGVPSSRAAYRRLLDIRPSCTN